MGNFQTQELPILQHCSSLGGIDIQDRLGAIFPMLLQHCRALDGLSIEDVEDRLGAIFPWFLQSVSGRALRFRGLSLAQAPQEGLLGMYLAVLEEDLAQHEVQKKQLAEALEQEVRSPQLDSIRLQFLVFPAVGCNSRATRLCSMAISRLADEWRSCSPCPGPFFCC